MVPIAGHSVVQARTESASPCVSVLGKSMGMGNPWVTDSGCHRGYLLGMSVDGSLVKHNIPVPGLQVFNVLPIPGYSNIFRPTLYTVLHNRYTYKKRNDCWCWHAGTKWLGVMIIS